MIKAGAVSEAIILAGGLGSRLRAALPDVPKPMAPVGRRPFLEYLMDHWLGQGIRRFVLSVGYRADQITDHFGQAYRGAVIEYVREVEPLGTGGALALALKSLNWRGRHLLALNGDTWMPADLEALTIAAEAWPVTLVLTEVPDNTRYGGVELEGGTRIRRFGGPAVAGSPALINTGCYLLDAAAVQSALADRLGPFSWENDFLMPAAERGLVGACLQKAQFIDIGLPADYQQFCRQFSRQKPCF